MWQRALIVSRLQAAEKQAANAEQLIVDQCKLIRSLEQQGEDTTGAIVLFREMEQIQLTHLADRDRFLAELAASGTAEATQPAHNEADDTQPYTGTQSRRRQVT